ncbi:MULTISPECIES: amino acid ABC transporter permease [unclassified Campylobacter]|uniref:amino acid ABC transporter permease n=1 Tax=unclassified Campylobacter TaxID=2593542 RepID=UPI001237A5DF|nr:MULTISPECIES: amino acid ABC transporter permease [unclassified Campylobacter]KAA6224797.1 amino acid ABC transporter permease [Campylobacter sp. LR185c]KAA6227372.1 amino acid ABC transporter permease [Campylobacter sp. LR196d]KAA6228749.1 amino acid ABC transporter permease [Campylobacter sp. LR286c]KAA6229559.1 amino acid ABC transporter permease [Campylobacter sp. LR264d]KAA6230803.1 amino acid ABC transporter permease [Campylobacter sp. LR291e]
MDYNFLLTSIMPFLHAAFLTIKLSFFGIVFSFIIGFFCILMTYFKFNFLEKICKIYIEFSRNTPLLIQLFFLYYALPKFDIHLEKLPLIDLICLSVDDSLRPSFACAVVGLSFLGGSYMAESLRAGFEAVRKQQFEAGLSLGFTHWQNLRFIIFPQALSVAMPSISANIIFLIKETSVVSIIALPDLVTLMKNLNSLTYKTDELLFMLFMSYLIIILPLSLILSWYEKRLING